MDNGCGNRLWKRGFCFRCHSFSDDAPSSGESSSITYCRKTIGTAPPPRMAETYRRHEKIYFHKGLLVI